MVLGLQETKGMVELSVVSRGFTCTLTDFNQAAIFVSLGYPHFCVGPIFWQSLAVS